MKKLLSFSYLYLISVAFIFSCSAKQEELESQTRTQYTLTVTAGEGGFISPDASGIYDEGTTITLSATPDDGYEFDRWEGSDFDNNRCAFARYCRTAITINSNRSVHAYFQIKED